MFIKRACILAVLGCLNLSARAQEQKADWDSAPKLHDIPAAFSKESAVIVADERTIEYRSEAELMVYKTMHRVARVLDDKGIEIFNTLTIPISSSKTIELIKARTILPGGKIIEITQDKIKTIKNDNGEEEYLLAFEGVEKNSEVEYLYTEKKPASFFGSETFQYSLPTMSARLKVISPANYQFELKGYNGFATIKDTMPDTLHRWYTAVASNIPALKSEKYTNEEVYRMQVAFKLSYVTDNPNVRVLTWKDMTKRVYEVYYKVSDKEKKAVEKYLASLKISDSDDESAKIRKIEDGIKTDFRVNKQLTGEDNNRLDKVIENKVAPEDAYIRFFAACFTAAGIKHELGLTSNRYRAPVDESFENWNILEDFVFYFPNEKNFLDPEAIYIRYPWVVSSYLTNKGIFCKTTTIGNLTTALTDIREIKPVPIELNHADIIANVSFTGSDLEPMLDVTHTFTGYNAIGRRELGVLMPEDKKKELVQSVIDLADKVDDIVSFSIKDAAYTNYYTNTPLKMNLVFKAPKLLEKAGNKYLFKIGDVIGDQSELYQADERKMPIDIEFPHSLVRTITLDVPAGYKVINPETLRIHVDDKKGDAPATMGFNSDYKTEGNKIVVSITEFYSVLHYPVSEYELFRKVINAAADFNKVTLVMVKE